MFTNIPDLFQAERILKSVAQPWCLQTTNIPERNRKQKLAITVGGRHIERLVDDCLPRCSQIVGITCKSGGYQDIIPGIQKVFSLHCQAVSMFKRGTPTRENIATIYKHVYNSRKKIPYLQLFTSRAKKSTGAMDVEAETDPGARSCHVQAAHGPAVRIVLRGELRSKRNDEKNFQNCFLMKNKSTSTPKVRRSS